MESFLNKFLIKKIKERKKKVKFVKRRGDQISCLGLPKRKSWESNQIFCVFTSVFCLFLHGFSETFSGT